MAEREADLLGRLLPRRIHAASRGRDIAFYNKALVYDLLFKAASATLLTIAADPKHFGARIGVSAVLHPGDRR